LVPFVKEIVPLVDLKAARIEIAPPPGLLEINLS
jgi:16S rRNA processing protein RimM